MPEEFLLQPQGGNWKGEPQKWYNYHKISLQNVLEIKLESSQQHWNYN